MAMPTDWRGKTVLVTGGTRGIGLACGLAFGKLGARVVLTHRWGSADETGIRDSFAEIDAPRPEIIAADVSHAEDTAALMRTLTSLCGGIDVFISNAAVAQIIHGPDDYQRRSLMKSMDFTTWPLVDYTFAIKATFARFPRYVIAISSLGPDQYFAGYDFVAASKAALETLARYLSRRLGLEEARVNIIRAGLVYTESLMSVFGEERVAAALKSRPECFVSPDDVAGAALALCSGWMDAVNGQTITVDRGASFAFASEMVGFT
jgi:NAD(P)-dependent dehydrogenase (short-subunit alcohol dehydrogenase family)